MPIFLDDAELSAQEFRDNVRWRLGLKPLRLPTNCKVCGVPFSAEHACRCNIDGLVTLRHNLLSDKWGDLCAKSLTPTAISGKPRIHTGSQLKEGGGGFRQSK